MPEILVKHEDISRPDTITQEMVKKFKEKDLDIHTHEVTDIDDDFKKGVRKITVKATKYFFMGK